MKISRAIAFALALLSIAAAPAAAQQSFGQARTISSSVTRPSNTTQYTASTAWANATSSATYGTLTGVCRSFGKTVYVPDILLIDEANQATKLQVTLFLFDAPPTAINDDATFSVASADWPAMKPPAVAVFSNVLNQTSGSGGAVSASVQPAVAISCRTTDTNLYFMVRVDNTYTPLSAEKLDVNLKVVDLN